MSHRKLQNIRIVILLLSIFMMTGKGLLRAQTEVRFAILSDIHHTPGGATEEQLKDVINDINTLMPDFVIVSGDLTNTGSDAELKGVKEHLEQLKVPVYAIPGNHENNWSESAGHTFNALWGADRFVFEKGGYVFMGINTGPYMRMGDGHVKNQDLGWMREELSNRMHDGKDLIFIAHYPLQEGLDRWMEVLSLLSAYDCKLAICGHGHKLEILKFGQINGLMARSLVYRNDTQPGYTLVEATNGQARVFEVLPGQRPYLQKHVFDFPQKAHQNAISISETPGYEVNSQFPQARKIFEHRDSASVFTGVLPVGDSLVIYGNSKGFLKALRLKDKSVEWEQSIGEMLFSTPVIAEEVIVAGSDKGGIYGLSLKDGRVLWKVETQGPVLAAPALENGFVYIAAGDEAFFKIEANSGRVVWKFEGLDAYTQARAVLSDNRVVFTAWDTHVYCLDKESGQLLWKWNNKRPQMLLSPGNVQAVVMHEKVFIVAPDRYMTALELKTGHEIWRSNRHQVRESMGGFAPAHEVYAKLMNDSIIAISALGNEMQTLWVADATFGYDHNPCPIVSDGRYVFAATRYGNLVAVDTGTKSLAWKHKADHTAINFISPGADNVLWISTAGGLITAIAFE